MPLIEGNHSLRRPVMVSYPYFATMTHGDKELKSQGKDNKTVNHSDRDSMHSRMIIYLLILVIFIAAFEYKGYLLSRLEGYNLPDADGAFWTEAAFHFRHARMVKDGVGIPSLDRQIQYPEGIEVWKYCTPFMDIVYGSVYRLGLDFGLLFHRFMLKAQAFWCTLSILGVFLGSLVLWRNRWGALLATAFYAFSLGHMDRTTIYLRENFALPLVWLHLAFFIMAVRSEKKGRNVWLSILSALLLAVAFNSWHVVRFYFLIFVVGIVVTQLPLKGRSVLESKEIRNIRRALLIITIVNIVAALVFPVLRASRFVFDPSMALSIGLLICFYLVPIPARLKGRSFYFLSMMILAVFFFASYGLQRAQGLYSHVTELLMAKIRFMGTLPNDPNLLSYEAREMWNGPFMSPSPVYFSVLAIPGLVLMSVVVILMIRDWLKGQAHRFASLMIFLGSFFMIYFLLVMRFHVFMHVPIALLAAYLCSGSVRKLRILGSIAITLLIVVQIFLLVTGRMKVIQPGADVLRSLTGFLKKETSRDAVFACEFNLGPTIACDADRAVLLQSKFENPTIRKKIQDVYSAIFESEEDLLAVCKKYGASHFVLGVNTVLDTSKESMRYLNGKTSITSGMAAYQMHFHEDRLHHFRLIFQNPNYRVFQIGDEPVQPLPPDQYWPVWDPEVMGITMQEDQVIPDEILKDALQRGTNPFAWIQCAEQLHAMGRITEAESLIVRSVSPALDALYKKIPFHPPNLPYLAEMVARGAEEAAPVMLRNGQNREAALVLYRSAEAFALMQDFRRAIRLLDRAIACDPGDQNIIITREQLQKRSGLPSR